MFAAKNLFLSGGNSTYTAFSAYTASNGGVSACGNGPSSIPGTVRSFSNASVAVSNAPLLRRYWSDTNGSQTYGTDRDVVFVNPSTIWTWNDFTNMGILYTDVRSTTATRTVNATVTYDDIIYGGYWIITKTSATSMSTWSSISYSAQAFNLYHPDGGRSVNEAVSAWTMPTLASNQMMGIYIGDNNGCEGMTFAIT